MMATPEIHRNCTALPSDRTAPAAARRAVRALAGKIPDLVLDDVLLAASELATNAIMHAPSVPPPTIEVVACGDCLHLTVTSAAGVPFGRDSRHDRPGAHGGFGLRVVDSVSTRWWVEHAGVDRVVCEFAL